MLTFGIQVMKTGEAFNTMYLPLMWHQDMGPVEVDPYGPPGEFTVYESGMQAMSVMSQIGSYGTRLVYLNSDMFAANNTTYKMSSRTSSIEFQIRDAATASDRGAKNRFWNVSTNSFQEVNFSSTKNNASISVPEANELRTRNLPSGIYELIQQTYSLK